VRWLYLLAKLGLGACLADDMGLGKTIQVLSLLLILKRQTAGQSQPSLLVAPASLLANWGAEIEHFAPSL
jgi:non-specific serine/threonine protein kinase